MIILLKDKIQRLIFGIVVSACVSFAFSVFINAILLVADYINKTNSKTGFTSIFLITFGMLCIILFVAFICNFFYSLFEIYELSEKWNISSNDIADGIYNYEIQNYWMLNVKQFQDFLEDARRKNRLNKNRACG